MAVRAGARTTHMSIAGDPRGKLIDAAFTERGLLERKEHADAVFSALEDLDHGRIRVAEKEGETWVVHSWVQKAVVLYFALAPMEEHEAGPLRFHDKVPLKAGLADVGVRVVPGGIVRFGSFLERGCVVMPGFVNIGARVGAGTMVDTWATVGSCAQIGRASCRERV